MQTQQGDVIGRMIEALPKGAVRVRPVARGVVVAEGEVTGHAHVCDPAAAELWTLGERRFLVVNEGGAQMQHEEHDTVVWAPGVHELGTVREKDWLQDAIRSVVD